MKEGDVRNILIFAHGAGAGKNSEFMNELSVRLGKNNIQVVLFNFPYMQRIEAENKRRPPDRMPKLIEAFQDQITDVVSDSTNHGKRIFIGGKSMGGRVASHIATSKPIADKLSGVICLGFPFHPPKFPEKYRGDHLTDINVPTLILQGERDTFGNKSEVRNYELGSAINVAYLPDGDHSFKPRVRSGHTMESNYQKTTRLMIDFMNSRSNQ